MDRLSSAGRRDIATDTDGPDMATADMVILRMRWVGPTTGTNVPTCLSSNIAQRVSHYNR